MTTNTLPENPEQPTAAPNGTQPEAAEEPPAIAPEPKLPTRKDTSLKELLGKMDDYAPIVRCSRIP